MSPEFAVGAAVAAAACGWPAAVVIDALGRRPVTVAAPADTRPRTAAGSWLCSLLLAVAAFGVTVRVEPALIAAAGCWLAVCGVPLAVIDVRVRRLPDVLTGVSVAGIAALLTGAAVSTADWRDLARAGAAGLAVGAFFGLLALVRPGSAGLGDAKLGLSTGALAGWLGWGPVVTSVFAAFVLAAAAGLWLVASRRATLRGTSLPFGPFLLAGCLAVVMLAGLAPRTQQPAARHMQAAPGVVGRISVASSRPRTARMLVTGAGAAARSGIDPGCGSCDTHWWGKPR